MTSCCPRRHGRDGARRVAITGGGTQIPRGPCGHGGSTTLPLRGRAATGRRDDGRGTGHGVDHVGSANRPRRDRTVPGRRDAIGDGGQGAVPPNGPPRNRPRRTGRTAGRRLVVLPGGNSGPGGGMSKTRARRTTRTAGRRDADGDDGTGG